ncbi:MAG TPA: hypothetical protein VKT78_16430 [Fimbriimonadaceae bacterium]|nr:hypothetical protein [Fimbriimonadaceae bacterium]
MKDQTLSRRNALKLARLGVLLGAGLGISHVVEAETGGGLRRRTNTVVVKHVLKLYSKVEKGYQLEAVIPMEGDVEAAFRDPSAVFSARITGKGHGPDGPYAKAEITVNKAKTSMTRVKTAMKFQKRQ